MDQRLTFFMQVYRDQEKALIAIKQVRQIYPNASILVRSDGGGNANERHFRRYHVRFVNENRLFPVENGGKVVHRMLELFLEQPTDYLFKIDPDTCVHRRFQHLPSRSGVFGSLQYYRGSKSIQGGCIGFSSDAAYSLMSSSCLLDGRLSRPELLSEKNYSAILTRRRKRTGLTSFDWVIGWACNCEGISMFSFSEIKSRWKRQIANVECRWAITHPFEWQLAGVDEPV